MSDPKKSEEDPQLPSSSKLPQNTAGIVGSKVTAHGGIRVHISSRDPKLMFQVKYPLPTFTGREKFLEDLHETIHKARKEGAKVSMLSHTSLITGMGGIGKSEAVRMYILKFSHAYDNVVWIDAENQSEIISQFKFLASNKLRIDTKDHDGHPREFLHILQDVYSKLCKKPKQLLIVFDNAEALDDINILALGIRRFLPLQTSTIEPPTVLITSRQQYWEDINVMRLGLWEMEECIEFIYRRLQLVDTPENKKDATELAELFGRLPIAIEVAVSMIAEQLKFRRVVGDSKYDIKNFVAEYEARDGKMLSTKAPQNYTQVKMQLLLKVSLDKIKTHEEGKLAIKILAFMTYLSPNKIPRNLMHFLLAHKTYEHEIDRALYLLQRYSIIQSYDTYFNIHRVLQDIIITLLPDLQLRTVEAKDEVMDDEMGLLKEMISRLVEYVSEIEQTHEDYNDIVENILHVLDYIIQKSMAAQFYTSIQKTAGLIKKTHFESAIKLYRSLMEHEEIEEAKPLISNNLEIIAELYYENGMYENALETYNELLEQAVHTETNEKHDQESKKIKVLSIQKNIAMCLVYLKRNEEALELYHVVLEGQEKVLGPLRPETLRTKINIAKHLGDTEKIDEALKLYYAVLEAQEKVLGALHPDTLRTQSNIAKNLGDAGKIDEALELYYNVLQGQEKVIWPLHPDTLITKMNIAKTLGDNGKVEEALKLYFDVLKGQEKVLGPLHPNTLTTQKMIAKCLSDVGKNDDQLQIDNVLEKSVENVFGACQQQTDLLTREAVSLSIGISLGTTNCCVAVLRDYNQKPEIIPNEIGRNTTPSFVAYDYDDDVYTGSMAKYLAFECPESAVFDINRLIGQSFYDPHIQKYSKQWPFQLVNIHGFVGVKVGEQSIFPQTLLQELFSHLRGISQDFLGSPIDTAVVTIPAYFQETQRGLTLEACTNAGLKNVQFITKPEAVAYAYDLQSSLAQGQSKHCLLFHLGGGTFEVTIFKISHDNKIEIKATGGDTRLGGENFNELLTEYCIKDFQKKHGIDLSAEKNSKDAEKRRKAVKALQRLENECDKKKDHLSIEQKIVVSVDVLYNGIDYNLTVTREAFESLIESHLNYCLNKMNKVFQQSGLRRDEVVDVVLTGGSCCIPMVKQVLSEYFKGIPLHVGIRPEEVAAHGAAVHAYHAFPNRLPQTPLHVINMREYAAGHDLSDDAPAPNSVPFTSAKRDNLELSDIPVIGIDFGTTYCCAAVLRQLNQTPETIPIEKGTNTTPSFVGYGEDYSVYAGAKAKELAVENPETTVYDINRLIGQSFHDDNIQKYINQWPFKLVNMQGFVGVKVGERSIYPQILAQELLSHLRNTSENFLDSPIDTAVVTTPAYFTKSQKGLTYEACTNAGLMNVQFITKPEAVTYAYGLQSLLANGQSKHCLLFHLGGGTFEVTIFKISSDSKIEIKATGGDTRLGGENFNELLTEYCIKDLQKKHGIDLNAANADNDVNLYLGKTRTLRILRNDCERKKIDLSTTKEIVVSVNAQIDGIDFSLATSRTVFEILITSHLNKCVATIDKVLQKSGLRRDDIEDVVLIGGSCRIPKLEQVLSEYFGEICLRRNISADEAVARGAAVHAYNVFKICASPPALTIEHLNRYYAQYTLPEILAMMQTDAFIPANATVPSAPNSVAQSNLRNLRWIKDLVIKHGAHFASKHDEILTWLDNFEKLENDLCGNPNLSEYGIKIMVGGFLDTLNLKDLASILFEKREDKDAGELYQKIHERLKSTVGEDHVDAINIEVLAARCFLHHHVLFLEESEDYIQMFKNAYRFYSRSNNLGTYHEDTLDEIQYYISWSHLLHHNFSEALELANEIYDNLQFSLGPNDWKVFRARVLICSCDYYLKTMKEARALAIALFQQQRQFSDSTDSEKLSIKLKLCEILHDVGEYEKALILARSIYEVQEENLEPGHLAALDTLRIIGMCSIHLNQFDQGLTMLNEVFEGRKGILGTEHRYTLISQFYVAWATHCSGSESALGLYRVLHRKQRQCLGRDHDDISYTKSNIIALGGVISEFGF